MGPYSSEVTFDSNPPTIGAVLLKLFEVTELSFNCSPVGDEGDCWRLVSLITSMEVDLMIHGQAYAIFSSPFDFFGPRPDLNSYAHESTQFALISLGGRCEEKVETWAGEPWHTAKCRWNPKHIDGRGRN
jgi:hypothetical protein